LYFAVWDDKLSIKAIRVLGSIEMIEGKELLAALVLLALLGGCQQANDDAGRALPDADTGRALSDVDTGGLIQGLESAHRANGGAGFADPPGAGSSGFGSDSGGSAGWDTYTPTEAFKGKGEELGLRLMERLLSKCIRASGQEAMGACYREHLLAGFDTDGTIDKHCPRQADIQADMKCIVLGGVAYHLSLKIDKDNAGSFDWSDPQASANEVGNRLLLQQVRDCLYNGAASDPKECVMGRMMKALELTTSDLEPCNALIDDDLAFGQCVGEAYSYKYMRSGIDRM
jgi:hypothetical protein